MTKTYRQKREARIQMALPVHKKERWVEFAKSQGMTLTELIQDSVDEYINERNRPRDIDIPGPYPFD